MVKLPAPKLKWKKSDIDAHRVLDNWALAPPPLMSLSCHTKYLKNTSRLKNMFGINQVCSTQRQSLIYDITILLLSGYIKLP